MFSSLDFPTTPLCFRAFEDRSQLMSQLFLLFAKCSMFSKGEDSVAIAQRRAVRRSAMTSASPAGKARRVGASGLTPEVFSALLLALREALLFFTNGEISWSYAWFSDDLRKHFAISEGYVQKSATRTCRFAIGGASYPSRTCAIRETNRPGPIASARAP